MRKIIVTGASGYIGQALVRRALDERVQVVALGRCLDPRAIVLPWRLGEAPPLAALDGADAVIHLAHQWHDPRTAKDNENGDPNIVGTRVLLDACRAAKVERFVFASTISAQETASNQYGQTKWLIEQWLEPSREVAARIGLVYGGYPNGLWALLLRIARLPVLPMVGQDRLVQPIHLNELCEGLLRLAEHHEPRRRCHCLATDTPVPFGDVLRSIARHVYRRRLLIVPVPLGLVIAAVDLVSHVVPAINSERVLGLFGLPVLENTFDLAELGLTVGSLETYLASKGRRRDLAREGQLLLTYLLGQKPSSGAIRRYVRGVDAFSNAPPLKLPSLLFAAPGLLRLIDPIDGRKIARDNFPARLEMAALIAEAEAPGALKMYDYVGVGRRRAWLDLVMHGVTEALIFPLRAIVGLFWGKSR